MKNIYIISILLISSFLEAQVDESPEKIVDTTIYSQVDASQESINAQLEIDKLDAEIFENIDSARKTIIGRISLQIDKMLDEAVKMSSVFSEFAVSYFLMFFFLMSSTNYLVL